ncbi:hypothetical protein [Geoalkalibacter halelectricus]|uniref:Lipoprotein n=1 Tax=Geoalkalibacter halelectricus TaxID=2847045 RepID=A0ABY5ZLP6_9BACT|nr:hypothetical protein [Geoalkalibacter halelectricus]MDO3379392.1 hypothetical protein [Geoalkalibacter halelectricus]UWZ78730.1 hypothetical protein L9S41_13730 [Geoalkalibacter halelectricus]
MRKLIKKSWILLFALVFAATGCTPYKSQEVGFRVPSANPNMQVIGGAQVAAESYRDRNAARSAFGFDIIGAGIQPVQVVIDNQGGSALRIVPEQTFLIDDEGYMWNILDSRAAYERVEKSDEYARIGRGAGRGGMLGAAGGALVGAAIGIVSGENVASAAGKGAALGGAGGAVIGGAHELGSDEAGRAIARDLSNKELRNRPVGPGFLGRGFLFFPAEAGQPRQLRLQMLDVDSGEVYTRSFAL